MNLNSIPQIKNTDSGNFFVLAGPCAIEGEEMAMRIAEKLVTITDKLQIPYVFKGSFKKANRSRIDSFSGIGDEKALKILEKVSKEMGFIYEVSGYSHVPAFATIDYFSNRLTKCISASDLDPRWLTLCQYKHVNSICWPQITV